MSSQYRLFFGLHIYRIAVSRPRKVNFSDISNVPLGQTYDKAFLAQSQPRASYPHPSRETRWVAGTLHRLLRASRRSIQVTLTANGEPHLDHSQSREYNLEQHVQTTHPCAQHFTGGTRSRC